jgi:hypothetical protein
MNKQYVSAILFSGYTQKQITTTYKIRTKYFENMRPNKHNESPKTNLGEPFL